MLLFYMCTFLVPLYPSLRFSGGFFLLPENPQHDPAVDDLRVRVRRRKVYFSGLTRTLCSGRPFFCCVVGDHDFLRTDGDVSDKCLDQALPEGSVVFISGSEREQPDADDLLRDHRTLQLRALDLHSELIHARLDLVQACHERRARAVLYRFYNVPLLLLQAAELFPESRGGVSLPIRFLDLPTRSRRP